jgi:ribosomal protein L5
MRFKNHYKNNIRSLIISKFSIYSTSKITKIINLHLNMDIKDCSKYIQINTLNFLQLITLEFPKIKKKLKTEKIENVFSYFSISKV